MAYEQIYRLQFKNFEGQDVIIHISDTTSGEVDPPTYYDLTPIDAARKTVSDSDSKEGVKSQRLTFSFLSTSVYNISTFAAGDDERWLVELFIGSTSTLIFKGSLILEPSTMKEKFLAPGTFAVELTASDNLGLLRDRNLVKPDGTVPKGKFRIAEIISWCLQGTNLQLPIKIIYNLFPEGYTSVGNHTFNVVYLDAKTHETQIGERESMHEALLKLLKGCTITQRNGEWWILRTDEMDNAPYRFFTYDYEGAFVGTDTVTLTKEIGKDEDIKLINKNAEVTLERKCKFAKQEFKFEFPREIVDNIDFSRGTDLLTPIVVDMGLYIASYANLGAFPAAGQFDLTYKANDTSFYYKWNGTTYVQITGAEIPVGMAYEFEDWTAKKGNPDSPSASTSTSYVAKITQYGDEKSRYVVLTTPTVASVSRSYMESNAIPVGRQDKFTASVDFRFPTNITNGGAPFYVIMAIRLKGEDGSNWWLGKEVISGNTSPEKWYQSDSTWSNNSFNPGPAIPLRFNGAIDTREWQSCSWDAPPVPVNGELFIQLCAMNSQSNTASTWDDTPIHYANLQFSYNPFINGSYQKYTGQYHKFSVPDNLRAKVEDQILWSDSPKSLFKGTAFLLVSGKYVRTNFWYNANAGTTGELGYAALGKYLAVAEWNQHNRVMRSFQGDLLGLDTLTPTNMPDLLHRYDFVAPTDHTNNKLFALVSYTQNLRTCKWSGVFVEVYDSVEGKTFDDDHLFKMTGHE